MIDFKIYGANIKVNLNVCTYCMSPIDEYSRTVDHLIPESRGGIRANKNKVPSCSECNRLKGDMTPEEFEKAIQGMIRLELARHKQQYGYLKKVEKSVAQIIASKEK